ncbi:MAG: hypothetical protein ACI4IL_00465 [Eubacterium sp.]
MKKYSVPELEIRMYNAVADYVTTSDPAKNDDNDLFTDDKNDYIIGDD